MRVSVTEAEGQLAKLIRRAEAGEEVILTGAGEREVRLMPLAPPSVRERRRAILEELSRTASAKASPGPDAARSQDFLYDENGLPG